MSDHAITHIPGLFYSAVGSHGGHTRIFGRNGLVIYQFHNSENIGYSNARMWIVPGIICLAFNDTKGGKLHYTQVDGWCIRWFRLRIKRVYAGFELTLKGLDTYVS